MTMENNVNTMTQQNETQQTTQEQTTQQTQATQPQINIDNPMIKFEALEQTFKQTPEGKLLESYFDQVKQKYIDKGEEGFRLALEVATNLYEMAKKQQSQTQQQVQQQAQTQTQIQEQQPQQQENTQTQGNVKKMTMDNPVKPKNEPQKEQEQKQKKTSWDLLEEVAEDKRTVAGAKLLFNRVIVPTGNVIEKWDF